MTNFNITILAGDGVGPEVAASARAVLEVIGQKYGHRFAFDEQLIGGAAIDAKGDPLPEATLASCRAAHAVFLGAVGGPKWDGGAKRPEQGLLGLRKALQVFANLRPTFMYPSLIEHSPLRPHYAEGVDFLMFRELTGGSYFGEKKRDGDVATDLCIYSAGEVERIARLAFQAARGRRNKVTSVDKANVMETGRLWRETVTRVHKAEFADVTLEHQLVDSMSMQLIRQPRAYDVVLTENMFGDILSDEASVIGGSIGLAPSASLGASGPGLFEPVHGSAPDIAGKDICNPVGAVLSIGLMLNYGLGLKTEAAAIESAVARALEGGARTTDLGGKLGTQQMTRAIIDAL
ncbi:MAG: 3-isopropylmalate dehydrogenase [Hyphomonadaceae bacterium]|nr:3-isopropylmalate dehydrogenase [Hyphomonadaceae bacterium]